ncbi:MAG: MarR family transcriptional regulator [Mycobacteriales bacterium]
MEGSTQQQSLRLERTTLQLINVVAYGSSSRAHSRRIRDVTGMDLPPSDIRFLEFLAGREPMPLGVVAAHLGMDLAQASRQATSLAELGHVLRSTDPADRRRTVVSLSTPTAVLMDRWLLDWSSGFPALLDGWSAEDLGHLSGWFDLVRSRLESAWPERMEPRLPQRWEQLADSDAHDPAVRRFLSSLVALISWVHQGGQFNDLLEHLGAPIRQHGYFTLRVVSHLGPMSIAEVAECMAIDPSQASKRLRQLTELGLVDRAVDQFDRRSSRVRVSRGGRALERKVLEQQLTTFSDVIGELPRTDRQCWEVLMARFMNQLAAAAADSDRWAGVAATGYAVSR